MAPSLGRGCAGLIKYAGPLVGDGGQGCTNVLYDYGKKTFWNVGGASQITEYRVPKKPIKTLSVPSSEMPSSCAMNSSGDLAVGILAGSNEGDVVIFKNASGSGTPIRTPLAEEFFDGYDNEQHCGVPWLRAVGRHVPHRLRSASERDVSVHDQRNEGDVERHCIALGFQRLRADLDRSGPCLLRGRGLRPGRGFQVPGGRFSDCGLYGRF